MPSLPFSYVPGLTFRSSTDTSSFSTASMATAPASLTLRYLLGHGLHGPVAGTERHFRLDLWRPRPFLLSLGLEVALAYTLGSSA